MKSRWWSRVLNKEKQDVARDRVRALAIERSYHVKQARMLQAQIDELARTWQLCDRRENPDDAADGCCNRPGNCTGQWYEEK